MSNIEQVINEARAWLLDEDAAMLARLHRRYVRALAEINMLVEDGLRDEYRIAEMVALEQLIREQINGLLTESYADVERTRRIVVLEASKDFNDQMTALGMPVGVALDPLANARSISASVSGPLRDLFSNLSMDAGEAASRALSTGVILRENPLVVAQRLQDALQVIDWRARTIARTEVLRAYRGSMRERMKQSRVIETWTWISARESKTCPMCWAMHGTVHPLTEAFASHPNCRCSQAPTPSNSQVDLGNGVEDFANLPPGMQQQILGSAGYRAYSYGYLKLEDFVAIKHDPKWGMVRYTESIKNLLGSVQAMNMRRQFELSQDEQRRAARQFERRAPGETGFIAGNKRPIWSTQSTVPTNAWVEGANVSGAIFIAGNRNPDLSLRRRRRR